MPPAVDFRGQGTATGGNAAADELRLPLWVLAKIAMRSGRYTGQLTVNFFQGGVTTVEWRQIEKQMK